MPLVRVPVEAEPQFAGFRFGHGFEHSIPQPDRYTVVKVRLSRQLLARFLEVKPWLPITACRRCAHRLCASLRISAQGKAKRNASRATAAIGRALNELARELEEIHDAEGTLWRRKGAAGHKGDLSPSEIMQRVSAHAERVAPVMGIVREEVRGLFGCRSAFSATRLSSTTKRSDMSSPPQRVEQLRRALGPEMDGSHWADRRKLDVLQKLRRERTLCAPSAPMELDAEGTVPGDSLPLDRPRDRPPVIASASAAAAPLDLSRHREPPRLPAPGAALRSSLNYFVQCCAMQCLSTTRPPSSTRNCLPLGGSSFSPRPASSSTRRWGRLPSGSRWPAASPAAVSSTVRRCPRRGSDRTTGACRDGSASPQF